MRSAGSRIACALFLAAAQAAAQDRCEPAPPVAQAIGEAAAAVGRDAPYEERLAPLRALRERFPGDLFVHVAYQDAVFEHGIEGHLREMLEEYLQLREQHPGDPLHLYLLARAFEGRGTRRAVALLEEVLALEPGFAPAQRTLAGIYGSKAFRDPRKGAAARRAFAAACPRSRIVPRPSPPPPHSTFFARLREAKLSPEEEAAIPGEVQKAFAQDEWRALRIRLFDWYTPDEQRRVLHDLQAEYWQGWRVLVRHYRRTGEAEKADALLAEMEDRLVRLQTGRRATTFAIAARTVLGLHAEAQDWEKLRATLARLDRSLAEHPDPKRAADLARVRTAFAPKAKRAR